MTIETATYINQLNASYPEGAADRSTADDHLRLIKATVLATFPAITGPVTVTHTELNLLAGASTTLASVSALTTKYSLSISAAVADIARISQTVSVVVADVARISQTVSVVVADVARISQTVSVLWAKVTSISAVSTNYSLSISAAVADIARISQTVSVVVADVARISQTVSVVVADVARLSLSVSAINSVLSAGFGGMTLLGTLTTTSGSTQTLGSLDLSTYKALYLAINGVSVNTGVPLRFTSISGAQFSSGLATPSNGFYGGVWIDLTAGTFFAVTAESSGDNAAPDSYGGQSGITTASTEIVIAAGGTLDAGNVKVYGVK